MAGADLRKTHALDDSRCRTERRSTSMISSNHLRAKPVRFRLGSRPDHLRHVRRRATSCRALRASAAIECSSNWQGFQACRTHVMDWLPTRACDRTLTPGTYRLTGSFLFSIIRPFCQIARIGSPSRNPHPPHTIRTRVGSCVDRSWCRGWSRRTIEEPPLLGDRSSSWPWPPRRREAPRQIPLQANRLLETTTHPSLFLWGGRRQDSRSRYVPPPHKEISPWIPVATSTT